MWAEATGCREYGAALGRVQTSRRIYFYLFSPLAETAFEQHPDRL
jgi:hypothetical protein